MTPSAISSGAAMRPMGEFASIYSLISVSLHRTFTAIVVMIKPGTNALTRTLCRTRCKAAVLVSPIRVIVNSDVQQFDQATF
jgi:hypothetical protein